MHLLKFLLKLMPGHKVLVPGIDQFREHVDSVYIEAIEMHRLMHISVKIC